jgi:hypothetical protein
MNNINGHVLQCICESNDPHQFDNTFAAVHSYVRDNFKCPDDIGYYFRDPICSPIIELPGDTAAQPTRSEIKKLRQEMKLCDWRNQVLKCNTRALYNLLWGLCSSKLKIRLRGRPGATASYRCHNIIWFVKNARAVMPSFDIKRNLYVSLTEARVSLYSCRQSETQTPDEYLECYKGCIEVLQYYNGHVGESYLHVENIDEEGKKLTNEQRALIAQERTFAVGYLRGADKVRYKGLLEWLETGTYPNNLQTAYEWLANYQSC